MIFLMSECEMCCPDLLKLCLLFGLDLFCKLAILGLNHQFRQSHDRHGADGTGRGL